MGSLESRWPLKRDHHLQPSSSVRSNVCGIWGQRGRSRLARLVLVKRINFLQLISAVSVFFFCIFLFQFFSLPGSGKNEQTDSNKFDSLFVPNSSDAFSFLQELDYGEDVKFEPLKILAKFKRGAEDLNGIVASRKVTRFGYRKPKLALVSIVYFSSFLFNSLWNWFIGCALYYGESY